MKKPVISFACKSNNWFLYEMQHRTEMGQDLLYLHMFYLKADVMIAICINCFVYFPPSWKTKSFMAKSFLVFYKWNWKRGITKSDTSNDLMVFVQI